MKKYLVRHIFQYLLIFLTFATGIAALLILPPGLSRIAVISGLSLLYLFWGILHHHYEHTLSWEVAFEYLIFAAVILWILASLS